MSKTRKSWPQERSFVREVRLAMAERDWMDSDLCEKAGVSTKKWNAIQKGTKSPDIVFMTRVSCALGMGIKFSIS